MRMLLSNFLFLFIFCSCETIIDFDLPHSEPKITVNALLFVNNPIITNQQMRAIHVSISGMDINQMPSKDSSIKVFLYEDHILKDTLNYSEVGGGMFITDYQISSNHNYKVEAHHQKLGIAFGEVNIRGALNIYNIDVDTAKNILQFTFDDPVSAGDYYLIYLENHISTTPLMVPYYPITSGFESILERYDTTEFERKPGFLPDHSFNGNSKTVKLYIRSNHWKDVDSVSIDILRVDGHYYRHVMSKQTYNNNTHALNPESIQIYSNIYNGYGIVTGGVRTKNGIAL